MLAVLADWTTFRTELLVSITLGVLSVTAKWWGPVVTDIIDRASKAVFGYCRETRRNTTQIKALRRAVTQNTTDIVKNGVENAFMLDQNRLMLDHFDIAYLHTGPTGNVLDVSDAWCRLSGCPRDRALGDGWITSVHVRDQDRVVRDFYEKVKTGRPFSIEFMFGRTFNVCRADVDPLKRGKEVVGYRGMTVLLHHDKEAARAG